LTLSSGIRLGPYEIVAALGAGGMGEVYRARDLKLDRDVALKALPESVASDPEALARFEREAKSVAALSHPNILAIFDFGKEGDVTYAVTELLEGETLRERLDAGRVPPKEAVGYALQIARGLSAAHEKGILHRDLKPENVFVTKDGQVKILDFGLAKRVDPVGTENMSGPTLASHTDPGILMGTVGYMSPEQVRGLPVDHRSDIFSFGALLYELLSGKRAFRRETVSDTMAAIMRDEPAELSDATMLVAPALDHIVRHCLEKSPERRFHSAHDIAFALEEAGSGAISGPAGRPLGAAGRSRKVLATAAVAAALALLAVAVVRLRRPSTGSDGSGGARRIAVLPFENHGPPESDYFAEGISDEVRGKLTSLSGLQVIARGSSVPYRKTTKTPEQIARELNVSYLLTGTVRWEDAGSVRKVHVTPELVDLTRPDAPVSRWQESFEAPVTSVFRVQSDIASRVAGDLGVALGEREEKRFSEKPTESLPAWEAYLRGEQAANSLGTSSVPALRRALGFYEEAVTLDPAFSQAWAQIGRANAFLYLNGVPTPELAEASRKAAERAVALAPNRAEGYLALGSYYEFARSDNASARREYEEGRRRAPDNADLLSAIGANSEGIGRWEEAVEDFHRAISTDPRSVRTRRRLAVALLRMRRYPEAAQAFDLGLAFAPSNLDLIEGKAMNLIAQGNLAGAREVLRRPPPDVEPAALVAYVADLWDMGWALDPEQQKLLRGLTPQAFSDDRAAWGFSLAQADALAGDTASLRLHAEAARAAFEEQLRAAPGDAQRMARLGIALAYLGRKEEAVREGEKAAALLPVSRDGFFGPYVQHQVARIDILVGEQERALDRLEPLLKVPYYLSAGWLRVDPNFDPLRKNPRFGKLAAN
jgi:TolB-like protein/tetratricopeptide (TPR) repeat protein